MTPKIEYKVIPFEEWRKAVMPMWSWIKDHHWIPIINNPYGMIQYKGSEVFSRVIQFPITALVNGKQVGWSLVYNVSDTVIRVRGVYVLPEARGLGIGTGLYDYALSLWPEPWSHYIGYYDPRSLKHFSKTWDLKPHPLFSWRARQIPVAKQVGDPIHLAYREIKRPDPNQKT